MDYINVCGFGDIVEVFRYEKRPVGCGGKKASRGVEIIDGVPYLFEVGKDLHGQEEFKKVRAKESAQRAVMAFRRLVAANLDGVNPPIFASFTYGHYTEDIQEGREDFAAFVRSATGVFGESFKYVCVPEYQRSGRLHFHALIWGVPLEFVATERDTRLFASLWGQGFVDIIITDGSKKLATYVSKYMAKNFLDSRLFGRKAYICSRNIKRPWYDRDTILALYYHGGSDKADLSTAECLQEIEYDTQWLGRAIYKRYLLNPYAKSSDATGGSLAVRESAV